jgi:hypothetical protein
MVLLQARVLEGTDRVLASLEEECRRHTRMLEV